MTLETHNWSSALTLWASSLAIAEEPHVNGYTVVANLRDRLPGFYDEVACPIREFCGILHEGNAVTVAYMIQHLNDDGKWSREQIADWLETLDADLTFTDEPLKSPPTRPRAGYAVYSSHSGDYVVGESLVAMQAALLEHELKYYSLKHFAHVHVSYGGRKPYVSWVDETYDFSDSAPTEDGQWTHGELVDSGTPQIPTYDTLRTKLTDVPPNFVARLEMTRTTRQTDWLKYAQEEVTPPWQAPHSSRRSSDSSSSSARSRRRS